MEQFKEWWENISQREQQLLLVSAVFLGIAVLYWGVWTPLSDRLNSSQKQLARAEATLGWTQKKVTFLLKSGVGQVQSKRANLTQVLNSSARTQGITFSRIVNKKDKIEVRIANVEFEIFIKWLTVLNNEHNVAIINADLSQTKQQGYIKVNRLLLSN